MAKSYLRSFMESPKKNNSLFMEGTEETRRNLSSNDHSNIWLASIEQLSIDKLSVATVNTIRCLI